MEEYTDYSGKTKTKAVKVGLAPIFKDGIEYDYDVALEFNLVTTKTGKDVQVIRNQKPPRIPYFKDFEAVIPPSTLEGLEQWNVDDAVAHIKYFLEQGVDPKLQGLIDLFRGKLGEYKEVSGKEHPFSNLDFSTIKEDELRTKGKELVAAIDEAKKVAIPM